MSAQSVNTFYHISICHDPSVVPSRRQFISCDMEALPEWELLCKVVSFTIMGTFKLNEGQEQK